MKKATFYAVGFLLIVTCVYFMSHEIMAETENPAIKLNGVLLETQEPLYNKDGRVIAPVRFILEALGFKVDWNPDNSLVTATNSEYVVKITVNDNVAYVNEKPVTLDATAQIINDRVYVPVRFFGELVGKVDWDSTNQTVIIETGKSVSAVSFTGMWVLESMELDGTLLTEVELENYFPAGMPFIQFFNDNTAEQINFRFKLSADNSSFIGTVDKCTYVINENNITVTDSYGGTSVYSINQDTLIWSVDSFRGIFRNK